MFDIGQGASAEVEEPLDTDSISQTVISESLCALRILTLNRPHKLNAANLEMQEALLEELLRIAQDSSARVLILTGAGRAFSAGGDRELLRDIAEGRTENRSRLSNVHVRTVRTMLGLKIPVIAAVSGPAVGYAAGLVAMCDIVVMGEESFLCDPHVRFGMAATTATQLIWPRRASEGAVREILMTGREVEAREAVELGLADRLCPAGEELASAMEIAQALAALPASGVNATKAEFNRSLLAALDEVLPPEI
jgi:enoyl-CoA hydratase